MTENEIRTEGLDRLLRHIHHVREGTVVIGEYLIKRNIDWEAGRKIIANGMIHDQSKFFGIEFQFLVLEEEGPRETIDAAIKQHNHTNPHHPEYWNGIKNMPEIYVAEMVCDWHARSSEFGTNLKEWILDSATSRFQFKKHDKVYKNISKYLNILLDKPF